MMNAATASESLDGLNDALASRDPRTIAQAAMAGIWPLFDNHYLALTAAIEQIPNSLLEDYPVLWVLHRVNPVLTHRRPMFKPKVSPDSLRTMSTDEIDMLTLAQMIAHRYSGDVTAAQAYATRLSDRVRSKGTDFRERPDGPLWFYHQQIGSTMLAAGDTGAALTELATSHQIGRIERRPDVQRLALSRLALAHAKRGSFEEAERILAELPRLAESTSPYCEPSYVSEHTATALMGAERMVDDIDEQLARLEPFDSIQMTWPYALLARTRSLITRHRPEEALEYVHLSRDAHAEQHGSLAIDVMNAASIDALWALGAKKQARAAALNGERKGFLEASAAVRLALADDQLDFAEAHLGRMSERRTLSPAQHAERALLAAWFTVAKTGSLDSASAQRVMHIAYRRNSRRMLSQIPQQVITHVRSELDEQAKLSLDATLTGLDHIRVQTRPNLTQGELRVLHALRRRKTNAEIASQLHVSPNTIKSQLGSIYRKLSCSTRAEALQAAVGFQLFTGDDAGRD